MKLTIRNGIIFNELGMPIGTLSDNATAEDERAIELGSEAVPEIENFIEQVNSGKFKPRALVKTFEELVKKHEI